MKTKRFKEVRKLEDVKKIQIEADGGAAIEMKRQKKMFQTQPWYFKFSFWKRSKLKSKPDTSYIITMLFGNGTLKTFVVIPKNNTFKMKKKLYYIVYEECFFDLTNSQYHLFYEEQYCTPINREVIADDKDPYFAITPSSLKSLIKFEYVKTLASAHITAINWVLYAAIAAGAIILLIFLYSNTGG